MPGLDVWVIGGPGEKEQAAEIVAATGGRARDLTGTDLRNGILAIGAAGAAISNDSGLMHIAAAMGTPAIGIFGPTDPWHWAPLNPVAALIKTKTYVDCQPCHKPVCRMGHHRCMREIPHGRRGRGGANRPHQSRPQNACRCALIVALLTS